MSNTVENEDRKERLKVDLACAKASFEYSKLAQKYNELVDQYNALLDEKQLEALFTQGVFDINPLKSDSKEYRGFNVAIYLKYGRNKKAAEVAVDKILSLLNCDTFYENEISGSWFKRLCTISKERITEDNIFNEIEKVKKHIENLTINNSQANIDHRLASAVAELLKATDGEESVFLFGSFVVVRKFGEDGNLKNIIKTLSTEEQLIVATEQSILQFPDKFFEMLETKIEEYHKRMSPDKNQATNNLFNQTENTSVQN